MQDFTDRIWYTYKARIRASERLEANNTHSQYLLVWYALITTALSIITIRFPEILGCNTDISAAIMSVALLVVSLLVTNVDFRGRAIEMRRNYLALQHLYNTVTAQKSLQAPSDGMLKEYNVLLNDCENHLSLDDKYWRVIAPKQTSSNLTRTPSLKESVDIYAYLTSRVAFLFILYTLPLAVAFMLFINK
ncbi:MAG: SLATT domain-containing protein [Methylotenera sp.]|nr:SLATT domain-containing protein [Methylotenera sp.]MDD4926684.1 SLATT domain-containing protein [Methylotenera sp.]